MHEPSPGASQKNYLFGDSETAARRLDVLAGVFEPSTRAFLEEIRPTGLRLALDLGCGPGHTTKLVSSVLRFQQTVGLDSSVQFLGKANQFRGNRISFIKHDVTQVPFPVGEANVVYARFLASHLEDPEKVVRNWSTQLGPEGFLLLDEVEFIHTSHPVFEQYLNWVQGLLKYRGCSLYIGPRLATADFPGLLKRKLNGIRRLRVTNRDAARMFLLNVDAWADHPYIISAHGKGEVTRMAENLRILTESSESNSDIEWEMRQVAFERI